MKLKFYLRGLGIGILVTWVIMSVVNHNEVETAKAQARAEIRSQLEQDEANLSFPDVGNADIDGAETSEEQTAEPVIIRNDDVQNTDGTGQSTENMIENSSDASLEGDSDTEENSDPLPEADENTDNAVNGQEDAVVIINSVGSGEKGIDITVTNGDDSGTVARKLYNAGIIDNASEYDAYLMQHGYDKKIIRGTKTIYEDDSWQTIAEKLTSGSLD